MGIVTNFASGDAESSVKSRIRTLIETKSGATADDSATTWGNLRTLLNSGAPAASQIADGELASAFKAKLNDWHNDPRRGTDGNFATGTGFLTVMGDPVFTDTNATDPATATADAVGFYLDTSQGAGYADGAFTGLGAEEAEFTEATITDATLALDIINPVVTAGYYLVTFTVTGATADRRFRITMSPPFSATNFITADGDYSAVLYGDASAILRISEAFLNSDAGSLTISNMSAKLIPGNHGVQSNGSLKGRVDASGAVNFDGIDDRLPTKFQPGSEGCIAARIRGASASRIVFGAQGASDGRAYLALDASGRAAGGVGTHATATIFGGSDIRDTWATVILNWDGTDVTLTVDGTGVYDAAQSGNPSAVDCNIGSLNANGTASAFWDGEIAALIVRDEALTATEIARITTAWANLT